jgi:hypothetical protein
MINLIETGNSRMLSINSDNLSIFFDFSTGLIILNVWSKDAQTNSHFDSKIYPMTEPSIDIFNRDLK